MEFSLSGTENGQPQANSSLSYVVTSASGGIYTGTFNVTSSGGSNGVGFSVDANNATVLYVSESSYKITGVEAKTIFDGFMAIFGLQETYTDELQVYTGSAYFHSTGTQSMTYGTTTFPITTYVANSLPFTINECGVSASVTAFTLEVGTPPGTSLQFITYLHFAGTSNGETGDYTFQLVSMTVA